MALRTRSGRRDVGGQKVRYKAGCPLSQKPSVSIIIPALNEERTIASVLRSLARQELISEAQVIVVDGGSVDGTVDVAYGFPFVEVVRTGPGRTRQMNAGAAAAAAPVLWFLHADSTIPEPLTITHLVAAARIPDVVGGAFRYHLRGDDPYYKVVNVLVNVRARLLRRPYGDQGTFVRADVFRAIGGFRDLKSCEDLDLVLRLQKEGRFVLLKQPVETSARTWQRHGKIRTTVFHVSQWLGYEISRAFGRLHGVPGGFESARPVPRTAQRPTPPASGANPPSESAGLPAGSSQAS